ncbi:MAG TPA: VCBS repeat-containing protein, partial [Longimicrobiales bacterium]|nr:VCBS repeat-containing protein [Longimicrobiales bacterium]
MAVPVVLGRPASDGASGAAVDPATALERHGFFLRDVAADVGIRFRHRAPELDPRLEPIMPLIAATGASVSVADVDRDGRPDLYATTSVRGGANALYRNRGDGTFEDVSVRMGIAAQKGNGLGATATDVDGDGWLDLYV